MKKWGCIFTLLPICLFLAAAPAEGRNEEAKDLSVYYMSWSIYSGQKQQVRDLPWDRISTINHAFWGITPNADQTEFPIASSDAAADLSPGGCFDQYAEMKALYADVAVVISIGGWGAPWFPEMSASYASRRTFIDACVALLQTYPFISGIDIDWEYPGAAEKEQFTALMKEMREAFDAGGFTDAVLSFCAQTGRNAANGIDFAAVHPYVDRINIMTYDMSGSWSGQAMHHASLYPGAYSVPGISASESAEYLLSLGVPSEKVNIGTPLYSHGWVVSAENALDALGKPVLKDAWGSIASGQLNWHELRQLENTPGFVKGYDAQAGAAYLFCEDAESGFYQSFYSYESDISLQAKLSYIQEKNLGGLIVWSTDGDCVEAGYPMLTQMAAGLSLYDGEIPVYDAPAFTGGPAKRAVPSKLPEDAAAVQESPAEDTKTGSSAGNRMLAVFGAVFTAAVLCGGAALVKKWGRGRR